MLNLFLIGTSVVFDSRRQVVTTASESIPVGPNSSWLLDHDTIEVPNGLFAQDVQSRFRPAKGKLPIAGLHYLTNGAIWLRFTVPEIASDDRERTIRISDPRVRKAWLVWREPGGAVEVRDWSFDAHDRLAGWGSRTPAFHLPAGGIEGREAYVGFTSLSVLRGVVVFETRRAYQAWELSQTVLPSVLGGALLAIGTYLCVGAAFNRDAAQAWAGVMSFALFTTIFGGAGLFHAQLLGARPSLADFIAYVPKPLVLSAWLMFVAVHLRLRARAPRLWRVFVAIALVVPFQGTLGAFVVGLGWKSPFAITSSIPAILGCAFGLATLGVFAWHGSRRARLSLLCWSPLLLGTIARSMIILFPDRLGGEVLLYDPLPDLVVSMIALSVVLVLDRQARERSLRRQAEASEQRLREYSQIASQAFFEVAPSGLVTSAAGDLAAELGVREGSDLKEVGSNLDSGGPGLGHLASEALNKRQGFRDAEFFTRDAAGGQRWFSFNVEPWRAEETGRIGLRGTIMEVTERVERRARLAQQGRLAAMGQIAGGIAHEVNNLLHPVINLARRVRDNHVADREGRRLLEIVIDSGRRAGEVVEGVLESVSGTRRRGPSLPLSTAVERAVAASVALLPPHVRFASEIEPVEHPAVPFGEMLQVVGNLVQNASQAIDEAGEVVVSLAGHADASVLSVRDDGRGMSEELRRTAVEPFVTSRSNGTGLGLSAVASLVAGWGGTFEIWSREGEGTSVIIRLPHGSSPHG